MAVLPMPWLAEWLAVSEANLFYSPIFYVLISCNLLPFISGRMVRERDATDTAKLGSIILSVPFFPYVEISLLLLAHLLVLHWDGLWGHSGLSAYLLYYRAKGP
jgi:hypothetical protein